MAVDFLLAMAVAAGASFGACRLVMAAGVTDAPGDPRKPHNQPTPTSGGLGAALGFALGLAVLMTPPVRAWSDGLTQIEIAHMAAATVASFLFLVLGAVDDAHNLGPRTKFALFVTMAMVAPLVVGGPLAIPLGDGLVLPLHPIAALLGSALWVFVLVNAVNFLDGANGLSMGSVLIGLVGLAACALASDAPHVAALAFCGAAGLAGFLLWNFPGGRLFAGDAGALFAGALAALASLIAIEDAGLSPFIPVALFFPFFADSLLTLAWRVGKRPKLLDGHRDHMFQIALRAKWSHRRVSLTYWALSMVCALLALAVTFIARGQWLPFEARGGVLEAAASYAPFALFVLMAGVSLLISARVRAFARANGHDVP